MSAVTATGGKKLSTTRVTAAGVAESLVPSSSVRPHPTQVWTPGAFIVPHVAHGTAVIMLHPAPGRAGEIPIFTL